MDDDDYLAPGRFIDSDSPRVAAFAREAAEGARDGMDAALRLYRAVRDDIVYDPYVDLSDPASFRASDVLAQGRGFCVGKASLLAACGRVLGIPTRMGFADVRNHLTSPRLYDLIKTDTFRWHAYSELYLEGKWVKATPAFNASLCDRVGVKTLEFDGRTDSLFQPYDRSGRRHMEYVCDRGSFADIPIDTIFADFNVLYPALMKGRRIEGDFQTEAVAGANR